MLRKVRISLKWKLHSAKKKAQKLFDKACDEVDALYELRRRFS